MQHFAKISTTLDFLYILSSTQISKAQSILSSGGSSLAQCFLLLQILLQLLLLLLLPTAAATATEDATADYCYGTSSTSI